MDNLDGSRTAVNLARNFEDDALLTPRITAETERWRDLTQRVIAIMHGS